MAGTYNSWVVLLSFLVAVLASYTALDLASRITASAGAAAACWLLGGAFAMGMGIWSMHFIGMLAFSLPIPMAYDVGITLASMGIAIITFLILCGTLSLSVLDARMESKTAQMASSLREANAELQHLVLHDSLTKLPNRLLLEDRVQQAVEECRRGNSHCAVLFVDLDRFKTLNDSLGHFAGDTVLRAVAERLRSTVRLEDTVSRLGGDEFVVLLKHIAKQDDAAEVARKIIDTLARPIILDKHELRIGSSVGNGVYS